MIGGAVYDNSFSQITIKAIQSENKFEKFMRDICSIQDVPEEDKMIQQLEFVLGKKLNLINVTTPMMKNMFQFLTAQLKQQDFE